MACRLSPSKRTFCILESAKKVRQIVLRVELNGALKILNRFGERSATLVPTLFRACFDAANNARCFDCERSARVSPECERVKQHATAAERVVRAAQLQRALRVAHRKLRLVGRLLNEKARNAHMLDYSLVGDAARCVRQLAAAIASSHSRAAAAAVRLVRRIRVGFERRAVPKNCDRARIAACTRERQAELSPNIAVGARVLYGSIQQRREKRMLAETRKNDGKQIMSLKSSSNISSAIRS